MYLRFPFFSCHADAVNNWEGLQKKCVRADKGPTWMPHLRNTTKITQEKDSNVVQETSPSDPSQFCWGAANDALKRWAPPGATAGRGRRRQKQRTGFELRSRCKPMLLRAEPLPWRKGHLPAGNSPSLCLPARSLFFAGIGRSYPTLKEKRAVFHQWARAGGPVCARLCSAWREAGESQGQGLASRVQTLQGEDTGRVWITKKGQRVVSALEDKGGEGTAWARALVGMRNHFWLSSEEKHFWSGDINIMLKRESQGGGT